MLKPLQSNTGTLFTILDVFNNPVSLTTERWDHILEGHADMTGKDALVQTAVSLPNAIYQGGSTTRFVFDAYNRMLRRSNIVRAVVEYENTLVAEGGTTGQIVTAYLPLHSGTGQLGRRIYIDFGAGK